MLKQRILTAIILIPLFIFLVLKLSPISFCIMTGLLVLLGAWEWSGLMGAKTFPRVLIYPALMLIAALLSLLLYIPMVMYLALAWWITATVLVLIYPKVSDRWGKGTFVRGLMGVLVLVPCWLAINFIRNNNGPYSLLYLFILIWGADSVAYFVGRKWGKHKLAPIVSPGKSWQGFAGALVGTLVIAITALYFLKMPYEIWPAAIIVSLVTVIFSVMGDLFESMLKRKEGVKDSSNLLPGHGGILDRIDSLTAAAPIFVIGSIWITKIYH